MLGSKNISAIRDGRQKGLGSEDLSPYYYLNPIGYKLLFYESHSLILKLGAGDIKVLLLASSGKWYGSNLHPMNARSRPFIKNANIRR
jgi:hypothetical protein